MDVLPLPFKTLWICGLWHEKDIKLSLLQSLYKHFMIIIVYQVCVFQLLGTFLMTEETADLVNDLGITLTILTFIIKFHNFLVKRNNIDDILETVQSKTFQPVNFAETTILEKYKKYTTYVFLFYLICGESCTITLLMLPLIFNKREDIYLPLKVYYPFDTSSSPTFTVIYVIQVSQCVIGAALHMSLDGIFCGLLYLASGQFELMSYRLKIASDEGRKKFSAELKNLIEHHLRILELFQRNQSFNMGVMMICIILSLLILCSSIFSISKPLSALDSHSVFVIPYLGAMIFQVFLFCWYGNHLDMKSKFMVKVIYESDWLALKPSDRRILLLMMMISEKGLAASYHGICILSHPTFRWLINTSYASVNILKQITYR